jgi:nicotinamidase/pyrazinamidase
MRAADEALIVIDVQNDFCPGGALAVAGGDAIIPRINAMMADFATVVLTQDWHPAQVLWPTHCVQGSKGAAFHPTLQQDPAQLVIRKGFRPAIDSYSAFFENDRTTPTGLEGYLRARGVGRIVLVGLALDYCVAYSALDAARLGFGVTVVEGATAAIDLAGSRAEMLGQMRAAGVTVVA